MADLCCEYNFPGFVVNDETAGADRLVPLDDGIVGLDGKPIRRQLDPKGQTDGGLVHRAKFGPRIVRWRLGVNIQSQPENPHNSAYLAALNTLEAAVIAALEAQLNTPFNLTWTPNGQTLHTLSVVYGMPGEEVRFSGSAVARICSFTIIAADPAITVA